MAKPLRISDLPREELLAQGHRLCAGCGAGTAVRLLLKALRKPTVMVASTGCVEVSTTIYPYTSWRVPWVHIAFENAAAVASGIEAAFKAMARRGFVKDVDVIALAGDGGTFDIGLQALSGALERGHKFLYLCYDNEAYMNTGIQRSGATPRYASTTTSPSGSVIPGKMERKKDLISIAIAHGIPYAATASVAYWSDYIAKVRKGLEAEGPAVIHVLAPCPRGWRFDPSDTIRMARLAVQTRFFPLYEVENGVYRMTIKVPRPLPIEEYLKAQGRLSHLLTPKFINELDIAKKDVEENWNRLAKLCLEH